MKVLPAIHHLESSSEVEPHSKLFANEHLHYMGFTHLNRVPWPPQPPMLLGWPEILGFETHLLLFTGLWNRMTVLVLSEGCKSWHVYSCYYHLNSSIDTAGEEDKFLSDTMALSLRLPDNHAFGAVAPLMNIAGIFMASNKVSYTLAQYYQN